MRSNVATAVNYTSDRQAVVCVCGSSQGYDLIPALSPFVPGLLLCAHRLLCGPSGLRRKEGERLFHLRTGLKRGPLHKD